MWADRPGHDISIVIDRLFALVRNVTGRGPDEGFEVLSALFDYPAVPAQLDALAGDINVRLSCRVSALAAFEQLQGGERAQLLLAELLPSVHGQSLQQCARIAVRLGSAAIDMTRWRALQTVEEPYSDVEKRTTAAEVMRTLGLVTNVADLARSVLEETRAIPGQLERATEAWLAAQGETAVPEIAALASGRPAHDHEGRVRLAAFLHKAGDGKTAESLAGAVLDSEVTDLEGERACAFCARGLVAHPRVDGKELCDALTVLLYFESASEAQSVAEAAWTHPELSFGQRRLLVRLLAAVGQLDLAQSVWAHLLTWQGYSDGDDVVLIADFLNAGVEQWAADRIRELIDDPATAPLRVQRLRQMLAWLTAGPPSCAGSR